MLQNDLFPQRPLITKKYFLVLRYWAWLIFLSAILMGGLAFFISRSMQPIYQATTTVVAGGVPLTGLTNYDSVMTGERLAHTYANLMSNPLILEKAVARVGQGINASDLADAISYTPILNTQLVQVTVDFPDPVLAAELANTIVDVFNEEVQGNYSLNKTSYQANLQSRIDEVKQQISTIQNEIVQKSADENNQRIKDLTQTISTLKQEISLLEQEAVHLQYDFPVVTGSDQDGRQVIATQTPTVNQRIAIVNKLDQIEQQKNLLSKYQDNYYALTTNPSALPNGNLEITQLQSVLTQYQQMYTTLLQNYEAARSSNFQNAPGIVQIEKASVQSQASKPNIVLNTIFGFLMGFMLSTVSVYIFEILDNHIKDPEIISEAYKVPLLAAHFKTSSKKSTFEELVEPGTQIHETSRLLQLKMTGKDKADSCFLITSPTPWDEGPSLAISLAAALAQGGMSTILIDADMHKSPIANFLGMKKERGLSEFLNNAVTADKIIKITNCSGLQVIGSGITPPGIADSHYSRNILNLIHDLKNRYDFIIINAPPVLSTSETLVLATIVDQVIVALKPEKSTLEALDQSLQKLTNVDASIMGIVLNNMTSRWYQFFFRGPSYGKKYRKGYFHKKYPAETSFSVSQK